MFVALVALAVLQSPPTSPLGFAQRQLQRELGDQASRVSIKVQPGGDAESFVIVPGNGRVTITAPDEVGAMYGAYELCEQLGNDGATAWGRTTRQTPYLKDRGLNLFLNLPWDYAKNDTDYDMAALGDPGRWWFQNEDYWTTLLDTMAASRLNWLDIHGTYDISVTDFPNLYAYFVTSSSFPKVGVPSEVKQKNLAQLNHVVEMAHARGIRVSLMSYEAKLTIPHNRTPGYENTEANVYTYTREVVAETIRRVPGLDAIGFRIGESGHGESFFNCYTEAVKASGREIPLITRSWITRKQRVLPLARANKDFTVEIKYNGEHWGAPYMVAGGRVANWYSYSFEDYLSDSGSRETNAKTWPGNYVPPVPVGDGPEQRWPAQPYKIVWQVRANGTHRIFPFYNPEWVRRTIGCMKIGTASGYTIEGMDAYFPKSPDYYLADPSKRAYTWIHQRDQMYWMTWGRLGYDPTVPEGVFDKEAERMLAGKQLKKSSQYNPIHSGPELVVVSPVYKLIQVWKRASVLTPLAFMTYALGPDHRSHAPELEWGGDTNAYIQGSGFDSHSFLPINEEVANHVTGGIDGRYSVWDVALGGLELDDGDLEPLNGQETLRVSELYGQLQAMNALRQYYRARLRSAHQAAYALSSASTTDEAFRYLSGAIEPYRYLADYEYFKPFTDRLRMHTNTFSWRQELGKLRTEVGNMQPLTGAANDPVFHAANMNAPTEGKLTWKATSTLVSCTLECDNADQAWLILKPLPSSTYFHRQPMVKNGTRFSASFEREKWGHLIAAEVVRNGDEAARFPNVQHETPYLVVPSVPGPTPQIYSAEEAMTYLKPEIITPDRYGAMIIGTRGWRFFSSFDRQTRRKLLDPISRGMKLLILQQDFNRYNLDFLPQPLRFEGGNWTTFDPGGQLGLERTETADIMWQRFLPSEGWEVFGNGGVARTKIGKGEVWVVSARLMQRMHIPSAARNFVKLLSIGGKEKPTILIDSNSEGADFSSSNHPDLMNSHDIPFLTLGEVIALEQGMDSFTPVPGPTFDDDVLKGQGSKNANAWLKSQVVLAAKRPPSLSREEAEERRTEDKKKLLRSLGLDPMPEKTPLNTRTTGTLNRRGYRIEKVVYESRPGFYVTAHVYAPFPPRGGRSPVIVNVNGHWAHKKNEDRIQLRAAFQALRGYIAIAIDSPGWSFEGNSLIERRPEGDHNDPFLTQGGTNATGYYVWDVIRGLDYMATRPDTDMTAIGLTGASGGGLATLYAFAADDRFTAAVPVVYMASMELAPDNGCLCNHVPGTMQIGDRSDVLAIRAPKPVYIMGAENDAEFPRNATLLTIAKAKTTWTLFGKGEDVWGTIFAGGHDYNQAMREASIGFFDKYLKKQGDGKPVPQLPIEVIDPENRSLLVLDPVPEKEKTMRDLAILTLQGVKKDVAMSRVVETNGGARKTGDLSYQEEGRTVTFQSEFGLTTPGVLVKANNPTGVRIIVADGGKQSLVGLDKPDKLSHLYIDLLGTGELKDIELRYTTYLGVSVAYLGAYQIIAAKKAIAKYSTTVEIEAHGPLASLAALYANLIDPTFSKTSCVDTLEKWEDVFLPGVSPAAVQPRANLLPTLDRLRAAVKNATWKFLPRPEPPHIVPMARRSAARAV